MRSKVASRRLEGRRLKADGRQKRMWRDEERWKGKVLRWEGLRV